MQTSFQCGFSFSLRFLMQSNELLISENLISQFFPPSHYNQKLHSIENIIVHEHMRLKAFPTNFAEAFFFSLKSNDGNSRFLHRFANNVLTTIVQTT